MFLAVVKKPAMEVKRSNRQIYRTASKKDNKKCPLQASFRQSWVKFIAG